MPYSPPGDLPYPGIEPTSLISLAWQAGSLPLAPPRKSSTNTLGKTQILSLSFYLSESIYSVHTCTYSTENQE